MTLAIDPTNCDSSLLDTKDRLWDMLAEGRNEDGSMDKMRYLDRAEKVLFVLCTVQGMFQEAGYSYKGQEIAQRIADQCWEWLGHCNHAQTIKKIETMRNRALMLVQRFHRLQQVRMDPIYPA